MVAFHFFNEQLDVILLDKLKLEEQYLAVEAAKNKLVSTVYSHCHWRFQFVLLINFVESEFAILFNKGCCCFWEMIL